MGSFLAVNNPPLTRLSDHGPFPSHDRDRSVRSTSGEYFEKLDHVRALAAYSVFMWHALHGFYPGSPVPFSYVSPFPLAILDEGHVGVSIFMTLSGYLFAKLINGSRIVFHAFLWNRAIRLLPLLAVVLVIVGALRVRSGVPLADYIGTVVKGAVYPTLPNGGWSITAEAHFYLILPLLLYCFRRFGLYALALVAAAILLRVSIYAHAGEIQYLAYWTIVGRFDQFALGILFFHVSEHIRGRHVLAGGTLVMFLLAYQAFEASGGFFEMPSYPSTSPLWIILPTLEGACIALLIAYYDKTPVAMPGPLSRLLATTGRVSYSIYLLHFFFVFLLAAAMKGLSYPAALLVGTATFIAFIPVAMLSYRFLETPFLRFRLPYRKERADADAALTIGAPREAAFAARSVLQN
jgi:peptidoglycan/LPS O-acetylase OafA/YrhL